MKPNKIEVETYKGDDGQYGFVIMENGVEVQRSEPNWDSSHTAWNVGRLMIDSCAEWIY